MPDHAHDRIVGGAFAGGHGFVRKIGQSQHQLIARGSRGGGLLVEGGDFIAQILGLRFFGLRLRQLFLAHQGADFLADAIAEGLERLDFGEEFATLFVELEEFVNFRLIPCPTRGEALAYEIGVFADQFDVKHAEILRKTDASRKPKGSGRNPGWAARQPVGRTSLRAGFKCHQF